MRIAIFSDIHGNADALSVALEAAKSSGCERYLIAGDLVGYYYDASLVLEMISDLQCEIVLGNHEQMLRMLKKNPSMEASIREKYGSALSVAIKELSETHFELLTNAPTSKSITIGNCFVNISHGSPWQYDSYIYPESGLDVWEKFLNYQESIFVLGNTHHQMLRRFRGKLIINPGSIGQSRSDSACVQWAELDSDTLDVHFRSRPYDSSRVLEMCIRLDPNLGNLQRYL